MTRVEPPQQPRGFADRRVLVIGAGCSGLSALKECLAAGLKTVCFEKSSDIGGLWRYSRDPSRGTIYKSTIINTCKEMMSFSDFPPDRSMPAFMHNTDVVAYFESFACKNNLYPHIQFDTEVINVAQSDTYQTDGSWTVRFRQAGADQPEQTETFAAVLVCNGHHTVPRYGTVPGLDNFTGRVMHSREYRGPEPFAGRRVVVIGAGNSGLDIAVEISRANDCYDPAEHVPPPAAEKQAKQQSPDKGPGKPAIATSVSTAISLSGHIPGWAFQNPEYDHLYRPAAERSDRAKSTRTRVPAVHLVSRSGTYVMARTTPAGVPNDFQWTSRFNLTMMPPRVKALFSRVGVQFSPAAHDRYGLTPKHDFFSSHPTINGDLFSQLHTGSVVLAPDVFNIEGKTITFLDGRSIIADDIILATGYQIAFPFIDAEDPALADLRVEKNRPKNLYKFVFPIDRPHSTLAFIGLIQPFGAIMPVSEIQARWVAGVLRGALKLPSVVEMRRQTDAELKAMDQLFYESDRHTIQIPYPAYTDEIASMIGCMPPIGSLLLKDPTLFFHLVFKGSVPYAYRLVGPDAWKGARAAITQAGQRMLPVHMRLTRDTMATEMQRLVDETGSAVTRQISSILTLLALVAGVLFTFYRFGFLTGCAAALLCAYGLTV
ncbi:hypothetical protein H696_04983 [Fonticula alba]|uniref:Flavin-containing monooxygenase n=1 Tax=Fonticula alba TaxID=691883 RepID=A0A058Z356_FONAL|nr:hypothetical protein H696_04983 [Fonticula alba]KCV68695.1 hypothetical protein H696_04983 [Fonticula alba]|eukprot:XP_009497127.1 hypothetical protein H696_04983 [Fonticula alba]